MKKKVVGICVGGIDEEYIDLFIKGMNKYAKNYHLLYFYSFSTFMYKDAHDMGEKKVFDLINYDYLDAMIILPITFYNSDFPQDVLDEMIAHNIPVISVEVDKEGCHVISFDDRVAMEAIIRHVIEEHHVTRLNFLGGIKGEQNSEIRLAAYRQVLEEHNLPVEEERIGYGEFWGEPAKRELKRFLQSDLPMPEAIICANDTMALIVYNELQEAGYSVPEDVIVTGYDGLNEAMFHDPPFTTAVRRLEDMAEKVVEILDRYFEGENLEHRYYISSTPVYAYTCGCNKDQKVNNNALIRSLNLGISSRKYFVLDQIRMSSNLTGKKSIDELFHEIREYMRRFSDEFSVPFSAPFFSLCMNTDFLSKEEFSDIMEKNSSDNLWKGNSEQVEQSILLYHQEWIEGKTFPTKELLPDFQEKLEEFDDLFFFSIHIHDRSVGYAVAAFTDDVMDALQYYHFLNNVCISLESMEFYRRQETMITNLENKYVHDPLTGLYNRRGFYEQVPQMYEQCMEKKQLMMVVSVDLNGLKPINDNYGHADGDIAITAVADALEEVSGDKDVCARFGGDEFVVAGCVDNSQAGQDFEKQVKEVIDRFNLASGKPYQVSCSIGTVVMIPQLDISLDEMIKHADESMYEEKARYHKTNRNYRTREIKSN